MACSFVIFALEKRPSKHCGPGPDSRRHSCAGPQPADLHNLRVQRGAARPALAIDHLLVKVAIKSNSYPHSLGWAPWLEAGGNQSGLLSLSTTHTAGPRSPWCGDWPGHQRGDSPPWPVDPSALGRLPGGWGGPSGASVLSPRTCWPLQAQRRVSSGPDARLPPAQGHSPYLA